MKYITTVFVLFVITNINAQNKIDNILADIAKNNKSIIANQQYWEAEKLMYKTGLNPSNPKVEFEYLTGSPAIAGNQTDIFVVQSFDFPTAYIKKNQVANRQIAQSEFQIASYRIDILLAAKQNCLELVYHNKKQIELTKRIEIAEKILNSFKAKLNQGGANVLDVNKAKLQLLTVQNKLRMNTSEINQHLQKLTELNGGVEILFSENIYPITPVIPDFKTLETKIEENDPNLKAIHQQNEIDQKKMELSRAMSLPKLEGGYRSQELAGQKLQGIHLGITIPLWENKNSVKHQKEHLKFNNLQVEEHNNEHHYEIQQLYEKYVNLKVTIEEYKNLIATVNNSELLEKALNLGEISLIQYYMELNYYYTSYDNYLSLEKEYNKVIAELYKYEL
jgi:outer membrane protein TolC